MKLCHQMLLFNSQTRAGTSGRIVHKPEYKNVWGPSNIECLLELFLQIWQAEALADGVVTLEHLYKGLH